MQRTDHFLTQLKTSKLPSYHLALDTEAIIEQEGSTYRHRFACGVVVPVELEGDVFDTFEPLQPALEPFAMWLRIGASAEWHGHVVVWAHNLAYDLRVSDALKQLTALGWGLEAISIAKQATWATWRKGKAKLTLVDSMSWLPAPLEVITRDFDLQRPVFAYSTATPRELKQRCVFDCSVLATAVAQLLNYLRSENLGPFRPTGSGQSHAALRRRFLPARSVRVHTDAVALAAEREAMHTGRCEAWRHGKIEEPLREVDMSLAYCRIAAAHELPGELVGARVATFLEQLLQPGAEFEPLADITLTTDTPALPCTLDDRIVWPVGTFRTVLWGPELELAVAHASDITLHRCWLYKRTPALKGMATWLIERLEAGPDDTPPVVKRMLKHWARTLVGRCGLRYRLWEPFGEHPRDELCISHEVDWESGEAHENLRIGRQMLQLAALRESTSSVPSIPSWVASKCRANLWRLIEAAGGPNVAYMDTDGALLTTAGRHNLYDWGELMGEVYIQDKATHTGVTIYGPRNVDLGTERRLSGVPRKAIRLDELTFEGETWTGLQSALESGHADVVEVASRRWEITPSDQRRVHLPDGTTEPIRLECDAKPAAVR